MKNPSTILAVIGIIGVIAVAGYFYTQMNTYAPADITAEQAIAPVVNPPSAPSPAPVDAKPIAPAINPASTPTEPLATAPVTTTPATQAVDDEDAAEESTENTPADAPDDVTGSDEATTDAPAPNPADIDMPTDTDMKPQADLGGDQTVPASNDSSTDADPAAWTQCASDADCAPVGTECCAANYNHAVNTQYADAWLAKYPKQDCDPGMACIAMVPIAHCVSGTCTMKAPDPGAAPIQ